MLTLKRLIWVLAALFAAVIAASVWTLLTHSSVFPQWVGGVLWVVFLTGLIGLFAATLPRPEKHGRHE